MADKTILASIGAARLLTSRFYVCGLHTHSPASHDYGKPSDLGESPDVLLDGEGQLSPHDWIAEVDKSGIEILAITDHNACSWACEAARK